MPKMPDIFGGLVREWDQAEHAVAAHMPHRDAATETPAPQPVNLAATPVAAATPQEEPMFTIADLEADAKTFVAKFEQIDKTALAKLDAATSNPETDDVLSDIAKLAGLPIPAGAIAGVANGLKTLLGLYAPEPEPVAAQQAQ